MSVPILFDPAARRIRRDRAQPHYHNADFLRAAMLDGIMDRLSAVKRDFTDVLDLGSFDGAFPAPPGARVTRVDPGARFAAQTGGIQADEDALPFPPESFDLIVSAGVLDSVNDLPGALTLIRRALRPDGLFLGAFVGAGSLPRLRTAMLAADGDRPVARIHPQIDVRSAGDLLMRAGFTLPVSDTERLNVRYGSVLGLIADLRAMGATNIMPDRRALTRAGMARAIEAFAADADPDGKTAEAFDLIFLTGWSPDPSQPKPARRGSATQRMADALKPPQ